MKRIFKKIIALCACGLLGLSAMATVACGGGNGDELRLFLGYGGYFYGATKDSVWLEIETRSGVKFNVEGEDHGESYYKKLSPMLASLNIPDLVFTVPEESMGAYESYVSQGFFRNLDELIAEKPEDYPYLKRILNSDRYKNLTYLDKNGNSVRTLIPNINTPNGWAIYYRQDWLKEIGFTNPDGTAKTPATIEEFEQVVRAFSGQGTYSFNASQRTYGLIPGVKENLIYLAPLMHAFGVGYNFNIDEGAVTYMYAQPEVGDFITWFNGLLNDGCIDSQFNALTNGNAVERFYKGISGILITNAQSSVANIVSQLEDRATPANGESKASIIFGTAPLGTANLGQEGAGGFSDFGGYWGGYSVGANCTRPHDVLKLLEFLYSPEGQNLRMYGIEGKHYQIEDGKIVPDYTVRESEPYPSRFYTSKDQNDDNNETGYYRLGMMFGNKLIDWENSTNGEIAVKNDPSADDYYRSELIEQAYAKNVPLVKSDLYNVTLNLNNTDTVYLNKVIDASKIYLLNNLLGKQDAETYDQLLTKIDGPSYQWSVLKTKIKARYDLVIGG